MAVTTKTMPTKANVAKPSKHKATLKIGAALPKAGDGDQVVVCGRL